MSVMLFDWFITRTQTPRTLPRRGLRTLHPWEDPTPEGPHPGKEPTPEGLHPGPARAFSKFDL